MNDVKPFYLSRESAAAYCGLSVTTMEEEIRAGRFPAPRQLTKRRVAWALVDIDEWCRNRPASNILPPPNTGAKKPRAGASTPVHQASSKT